MANDSYFWFDDNKITGRHPKVHHPSQEFYCDKVTLSQQLLWSSVVCEYCPIFWWHGWVPQASFTGVFLWQSNRVPDSCKRWCALGDLGSFLTTRLNVIWENTVQQNSSLTLQEILCLLFYFMGKLTILVIPNMVLCSNMTSLLSWVFFCVTYATVFDECLAWNWWLRYAWIRDLFGVRVAVNAVWSHKILTNILKIDKP